MKEDTDLPRWIQTLRKLLREIEQERKGNLVKDRSERAKEAAEK